MNIHCSACGAQLPAGSAFCPGCRLPLTAHAVATVRHRAPLWSWLAMVAAVAALIMIFGASLHQHAEDSLLSELHAGAFTPESFQARCGPADQVDLTHGTLRYGHSLIELHAGAPITYATLHTYTRNGHEASIQIPAEESVALADLHCGGAQ